ncbi:MFS general substrate transporter [Hyaloscypha variabilis F]|uniref:MFS general substrate transporter n=1 Tax=Hyaloscypha variabilis (strain UAMH 11265 / GT02V1 / F) TaxID=1149755 RepID=A0A2J6QXW0_HYAVF|nr:MFS general substrate transporter [Hyaloscypha variabilis F]
MSIMGDRGTNDSLTTNDLGGSKELEVTINGPVDESVERSDEDEFLSWKAGRREWLIIIDLVSVALVVALDATILVPALPSIAVSLNANTTQTFWIGSSYLLVSAVVQPFIVNLSDIFGRRPVMLSSIGIFTAGTVICCVTNNYAVFIVGRSVQGIGGGGSFALVSVILADIIPLRQRAQYQAVTSLAWSFAAITGPLIGGLFSQHTTWRWCFYINFPFCVFAFVMTSLVVKLNIDRPALSLKAKALSIDWIGAFLFIASACSFLIGIMWGGSQYAWSTMKTILPIVLGTVGLISCLFWEAYGATQPFFRLSLFRSRTSNAAYFCVFLQGLLTFCLLYYIPFYFQACKDSSTTISGLNLMGITVGLASSGVGSGILLTKIGRYRWVLVQGWVLMILGNGLLILLDVAIPSSHWIPIFIVVGISHGPTMMSLIICIQAASPKEDVSYAASVYTFMRSLGQSVGVAIGATVFQNTMAHHLSTLSLPSAIAKNAEEFVSILKQMPLESPERKMYTLAYAQSFRNLFEVLTGFAVLGLLTSFLIKEYSLNRNLESVHVLQNRVGIELESGPDPALGETPESEESKGKDE